MRPAIPGFKTKVFTGLSITPRRGANYTFIGAFTRVAFIGNNFSNHKGLRIPATGLRDVDAVRERAALE